MKFIFQRTLLLSCLSFTLFQFSILTTFGQITLISPTGNGGFETGGTFAANGWVAVNSAANIWVLDNLAPAFAGARGGHVSQNGTSYDYNTTTSTTSHFYRDVAIPAGATTITLGFQWKGNGEGGWDRLLVYTAPTTVTPVANAPASNGTALAGATLVWTQPSNAQATYTPATLVLPNGLAGTTVRLIFTWQSDNSVGVSPPAAIDNISLTYVAPTPMTYTSSTSVDIALGGSIERCGFGVPMTRVEVVTGGGMITPLSLTQLNVNTTGTSAFGTIDKVHVYYTGTSATFAATNEFVLGGLSPAASLTFNDTRTLALGTNYFWVVYDFNNTGTIGTTIGSQLPVTGSLTVVTPKNPTATPNCLKTFIACPAYPTSSSLWLKGNAGTSTTTNGALVSSWASQAVSPVVSVTQATAVLQPTYRNGSGTGTLNRFNYNPWIYTDGTSNRLTQFGDINLGNTTTGFSVYQVVGEDLGIVSMDWYHTANGSIKTKGDGIMYISNANGVTEQNAYSGVPYTVQAYLQSVRGVPNGITGSGKFNGLTTGTYGIGWRIAAQNGISIGSSLDNVEFMQGGMGEFIIFPSILDAALSMRVESYLAIKYGITLGNPTAPCNYVSSNGTVIWSGNTTYQNNIIGIGRDNAAGSSLLVQKQSHYYSDLVRLYKGTLAATNVNNTSTFAVNNSFVISGDNAGLLCATFASNAEVPVSCGLYSRLEREWRIKRTNMGENINMDIKLAACGVPGSVNVANLRLLVDDDGNFANGGTTCYFNGDGTGIVISYANPTITVSNISTTHLPNNGIRYLTIGSIQVLTPLPVELLSFDAKRGVKNRTVDVEWTTASELNNDYFIIEKRTENEDWSAIAHVDGAGTSTTILNYLLVDEHPVLGNNYYRLKQVDFDGSTFSSEIRVVNFEDIDATLIYPNPATNSLFIAKNNIDRAQIHIVNELGQVVNVETISTGSNIIELDVSSISRGVYFVWITGMDSVEVQKVVIE